MGIDVEKLAGLIEDAAIRYAGGSPIDFRPTAKEISALVLEEAAKAVEAVSYRSRWMKAGTNSKSIQPCEHAQIIRALAKGSE